MINAITGAVALVLLVSFLGYYMFLVVAPPLWIIISLILVLFACDFVQSLREAAKETPNGAS